MTWLCTRGHVATTQQLRAAGVSKFRLASAVADGKLLALRTGVYACPHLDASAREVAGAGVLFDCVSALARHEDLWSGPLTDIPHVRAGPNDRAPRAGSLVVHWRRQFGEPVHPFEVSPLDALLQAMSCLSPYDSLAAVESAMHLGYLDQRDLDRLLDLAPDRMRCVLERMDLSSMSGFETHTRVQLVDAGHHVVSQVDIPGAGPLDLLVDDLVGIETDGRKWHGARFLSDRTKDIRVGAWGIPVLRLARPHIFEEWPETLATIEQLIAQTARRLPRGRRFFPTAAGR